MPDSKETNEPFISPVNGKPDTEPNDCPPNMSKKQFFLKQLVIDYAEKARRKLSKDSLTEDSESK